MPFQMVLIGDFPVPAAWRVPAVEARILFEIGEATRAGGTRPGATPKVPF
jgi:hypothetical protein